MPTRKRSERSPLTRAELNDKLFPRDDERIVAWATIRPDGAILTIHQRLDEAPNPEHLPTGYSLRPLCFARVHPNQSAGAVELDNVP